MNFGKMWILEKCEFWNNVNFEKCEFWKMWILKNVYFGKLLIIMSKGKFRGKWDIFIYFQTLWVKWMENYPTFCQT